jgi:hypothetical protein
MNTRLFLKLCGARVCVGVVQSPIQCFQELSHTVHWPPVFQSGQFSSQVPLSCRPFSSCPPLNRPVTVPVAGPFSSAPPPLTRDCACGCCCVVQEVPKVYVLVHDESEPSASLQNAADLLRQMKVPHLTIPFNRTLSTSRV